jgi:hypothetical protein
VTATVRRRPGRPRLVDRPGFLARWAEVGPLVLRGEISHGEAARRLDIGYASVLRLLRAANGEAAGIRGIPSPPPNAEHRP